MDAVKKILESTIERLSRDLKGSGRTMERQFQDELPVYEKWTQQLIQRFYEDPTWNQSCSSRTAADQCKAASYHNGDGVQCEVATSRFYQAAPKHVCAPVATQWRKISNTILNFSKDVTHGRPPTVPLLGMIQDILVQFQETRKSATLLQQFIESEKQDVRADIQACQFYFLAQTFFAKSTDTNLYRLLNTNVGMLQSILSNIFTADVPLYVRLQRLEYLFEEYVSPESMSKRTSSYFRRTPVLALTTLLGLLALTTTGLVSADQTQNGIVQSGYNSSRAPTGQELATTFRETQLLHSKLPLALQQQLQSEGSEGLGLVALAENLPQQRTNAEAIVMTFTSQYVTVNSLNGAFQAYKQAISKGWPSSMDVQFKAALNALETYGTENLANVGRMILWNEYQELEARFAQFAPNISIPKEVTELFQKDIEAPLSRTFSVATLANPASFNAFYRSIVQYYDPNSRISSSSYYDFVVEELAHLLNFQLQLARSDNSNEVPIIEQGIIVLEIIRVAAQTLSQYVQDHEEKGMVINAAGVQELIGKRGFTVLKKNLKVGYDIDATSEDFERFIDDYNTALGKQYTNKLVETLSETNLKLERDVAEKKFKLEAEERVSKIQGDLAKILLEKLDAEGSGISLKLAGGYLTVFLAILGIWIGTKPLLPRKQRERSRSRERPEPRSQTRPEPVSEPRYVTPAVSGKFRVGMRVRFIPFPDDLYVILSTDGRSAEIQQITPKTKAPKIIRGREVKPFIVSVDQLEG